VFKFNIKKNDRKPDEPFFNICESFANDDRFYLDRAKKNSRKLNKFIGSTKIGPTNKKVKHEHREVR
jgi:hypothetical protein